MALLRKGKGFKGEIDKRLEVPRNNLKLIMEEAP